MLFSSYAAPAGGERAFSLRITWKNPEVLQQWMELDTIFKEKYKILFREVVFQVHKYLIRITPVMSGRLRAGWTGILNKYNQDYTAAFTDTSLLDHAYIKYDQQAIAEGMAMSQFLDEDFVKVIINDVLYGDYVEVGTSRMQGQHFTRKAMYKAEYIFKKEFDDWFKEIAIKGEIVEPTKPEECLV
jgi:hypothetical protein